jgi:hypothetical protein
VRLGGSGRDNPGYFLAFHFGPRMDHHNHGSRTDDSESDPALFLVGGFIRLGYRIWIIKGQGRGLETNPVFA